jgi:hypothetical protein
MLAINRSNSSIAPEGSFNELTRLLGTIQQPQIAQSDPEAFESRNKAQSLDEFLSNNNPARGAFADLCSHFNYCGTLFFQTDWSNGPTGEAYLSDDFKVTVAEYIRSTVWDALIDQIARQQQSGQDPSLNFQRFADFCHDHLLEPVVRYSVS